MASVVLGLNSEIPLCARSFQNIGSFEHETALLQVDLCLHFSSFPSFPTNNICIADCTCTQQATLYPSVCYYSAGDMH